MKVLLAGAAVAAFTIAFGGAASATVCTNSCDKTYTQCSAANGANAQPACMPGWMQCKKSCNAPTATPVRSITPLPKPKH